MKCNLPRAKLKVNQANFVEFSTIFLFYGRLVNYPFDLDKIIFWITSQNDSPN